MVGRYQIFPIDTTTKNGVAMIQKIEVINWEKYNPRSDYHTHWFRIEDDLLSNPNIPEMNGEEFKVFIYIMCITCQKQGKSWFFDITRIGKMTGCSDINIKSVIKKLEQFQIIKLTIETVSNPIGFVSIPIESDPTIHNETIHNEHNKHDQKLNFDRLYSLFPRKMGKKKGLEKCKRCIKTEAQYLELNLAVENYAKHCKKENIELRFIKHFSTFMASWEDWVAVDHKTPPNRNLAIVGTNCERCHGDGIITATNIKDGTTKTFNCGCGNHSGPQELWDANNDAYVI